MKAGERVNGVWAEVPEERHEAPAKPAVRWPDRLGEWIADRLDRWLLGVHRPIVGYDAFCKHCRTSWPCDMVLEAARRVKERSDG